MCEEHAGKWGKTGEDRLSQSPLLLVSGSGSRPSSRSLAHFATENKKFLARALRSRKILSSTCGHAYREDTFRLLVCFTEFYLRNFYINVKDRVKEDGAFKFYGQESSRTATIHKA